MITKLCDYGRRSDFILDVLRRELEENNEQQVMILAHNKSLLKYLHDAIAHRNIGGGSVGYYVGGMKDADLKASETKKIIIATYAMASEGLDIPTLTTLIMATPKTDVCQSVGRILRTKHSSPLVIDIIDYHDIFRNQWMKRQAYYAKQGYHIMYTNNVKYFKNEWKTRDRDARDALTITASAASAASAAPIVTSTAPIKRQHMQTPFQRCGGGGSQSNQSNQSNYKIPAHNLVPTTTTTPKPANTINPFALLMGGANKKPPGKCMIEL